MGREISKRRESSRVVCWSRVPSVYTRELDDLTCNLLEITLRLGSSEAKNAISRANHVAEASKRVTRFAS